MSQAVLAVANWHICCSLMQPGDRLWGDYYSAKIIIRTVPGEYVCQLIFPDTSCTYNAHMIRYMAFMDFAFMGLSFTTIRVLFITGLHTDIRINTTLCCLIRVDLSGGSM